VSWEPLNLAAPEFAKPSKPPSLCGLVYKGRRHLISGAPEAAKTLICLILGLEEIRVGGRLAIVDFESGPAETRRLLEDLGATEKEIASILYYEPEGAPDDGDIDHIASSGVTLAIIDALAGAYDASGLDDEKRKDVERFSRTWIRPLWRHGITTIAVDHVVKNPDNRGRFSIGSERKLGAVDVHLGLKAQKQLHRGASGLVTISTHKDRPAHLERPAAAELELVSNVATHGITWRFRRPAAVASSDDNTWRPTVYMEKVSAYLQRQAAPVNRGTIYKDVGGRREYVVQAIDFLLLDGHATETNHDGTKLVSLVTPFPSSPSGEGNGGTAGSPGRRERAGNGLGMPGTAGTEQLNLDGNGPGTAGNGHLERDNEGAPA
jgi:hypothetical protein